MEQGSSIVAWYEGPVDRTAEHFGLRYSPDGDASDDGCLVAVVGPVDQGRVAVEFTLDREDPANAQAAQAVIREIETYLIEKGEPDPWRYAQYHCGTMANVYSSVRWSYTP